MEQYSENVGIAFAAVGFAGASTAIGASVVFFPSLIKYADRKTLAGGLGLSAGVMTYVSFVEIFSKSVKSFVKSDFMENQAYLSATLCFFAGIILMVGLNLLIHGVAAHNLITEGQYGPNDGENEDESLHDEDSTSASSKKKKKTNGSTAGDVAQAKSEEGLGSHLPSVCHHGEDPVAELEELKMMAKSVQEVALASKTDVLDFSDEPGDVEEGSATSIKDKQTKKKKRSKKEQQRLHMMAINTAIAIALHNFPEGLATFVATLQEPKMGAMLAIAVAIHNIPEGLCVAMPVYYATGNRWKAFGWAVLSGVSEPLAALLGWAILAKWMSNVAYAVLFGIVAGMMVTISIKELLPTAHRYDPQDSVVTNMFIVGMAVMAFSLVMFAHV